MTTETERVTLQILEIVVLNPQLSIYATVYAGSSIVVSSRDLVVNNAFYTSIYLNNSQSANELHRLYEHLKDQLQQLKG